MERYTRKRGRPSNASKLADSSSSAAKTESPKDMVLKKVAKIERQILKRQTPSPWSQETVDYGLGEARDTISDQRVNTATENRILEAVDTLSQAITSLDEWMAELGAENLKSNEEVQKVKK
eukprot:4755208-Amphidinium_carterae.1